MKINFFSGQILKKSLYVSIMVLLAISSFAQRALNDLEVPLDHPRLFWNDDLLQAARDWHDKNGLTVTNNPELGIYDGGSALDLAFKYLVTEGVEEAGVRSNYARRAIEWAKLALEEIADVPFDNPEYNTCNECRWYGQQMLLIIDWCFDELTNDEWNEFYTTLNNEIPQWNSATWGNPNSPRSNFNHGYLRQNILWAIMVYHENNELALELLDNAINLRWKNFVSYADTHGVSGIPSEGATYNNMMLSYQAITAMTMLNAGHDFWSKTDFHKKAIAHTIYNVTPNKAFVGPNEEQSFWNVFQYGDAGAFMNINEWSEILSARSYGTFMLVSSLYWQDKGKIAEYARDWADRFQIYEQNYPPYAFLRAVTDDLPRADISELSLDYFGPGGGNTPYGYTKNSWEKDATSVFVQMGQAQGGGHEHRDAGSFSIVRGSRYLVHPPAGRGFGSGWMIPNYDGTGAVDVQSTVAKNTLLFGGEGTTTAGHTIDSVDRLYSHEDFFFAANDLTPAYKNEANPDPDYDFNEHVSSFIREVIFLRELETLIVFDRTVSTESEDQRKTAMIHTQGEPNQLSERVFSVVNHEEEAVIHSLMPDNLDIRVIDETSIAGLGSGCDYCSDRTDEAHRIQMENDEQGLVYFLNVIQSKSADEERVSIRKDETETSIILAIEHPSKGGAIIEFKKGELSEDGSVGVSESGLPTELVTLPNEEQIIAVELDGPVWYALGERPDVEAPEIPLGEAEVEGFEFQIKDEEIHLRWQSKLINRSGRIEILRLDGSSIIKTSFSTHEGRSIIPIPQLRKNTPYVIRISNGASLKIFKVILQ